MSLYKHQEDGITFLYERPCAMLADEMGLGKSRQALLAASALFSSGKIDRMLILCPAAVRYSWGEELSKLAAGGFRCTICSYNPKEQKMFITMRVPALKQLTVAVVSYALLQQEKHVKALSGWLAGGESLLVADESSFIKNRAAKQTRGALELSLASMYRWLLTGTPVTQSPIDLYSQGSVMAAGRGGPIAGIKNFYHFRAKYFTMGGFKMKIPTLNMEKLPELQARFAPYVLRRLKKDCLDLPEKVYEVREVALGEDTWKIYQELRKEALLALPDKDVKPEPNAAVRILRLCQITSGHVGAQTAGAGDPKLTLECTGQDISAEKLNWLTDEITEGELANENALIVWCRWRRERERLAHLLAMKHLAVPEIHGGQSRAKREEALSFFQSSNDRRVLLAQPHAGGYGLNLTQAHVAIYLSNDWSYTVRVQSEDRCHRIGQKNTVTYLDVLATGPKGERTIDHQIIKCLREKKDIAELTCSAWRKILA
jgi:SNF2 family DNA or RNA helicase